MGALERADHVIAQEGLVFVDSIDQVGNGFAQTLLLFNQPARHRQGALPMGAEHGRELLTGLPLVGQGFAVGQAIGLQRLALGVKQGRKLLSHPLMWVRCASLACSQFCMRVSRCAWLSSIWTIKF
jgi:hypothetical protein